MKISLERDALLGQLQAVSRVASTRSAIQALSGVQLAASNDAVRAPGHRHGRRPPRPARGRGGARGRRRAPGTTAPRRGPRAARPPQVSLELRAAEQDVEIVVGQRHVPHPHAARRGLPAVPGAGATTASIVPSPPRRSSTTARKVARSASRDETRPVLTGILVSAAGPGAADGRDRLLPAERQGDARSRRRSTAPSRPTCRPARSRSWPRIVRAAERRATHASACAPNQVVFEVGGVVLSSRLIDGQFPNYRQLLPETLRARAAARRRRAHRRRAAHQPAGAEERAAAAGVRRGRADGLGADARTSARRSETLPVPFQGEPLEIGFNPEFLRDGLESVECGRRAAQAHQPAAPGPDRGRRTAAASCT